MASKPPTAKSQARERAWLRRQVGYLRVELLAIERIHDGRIAALEALLRTRYYPADPD